MKPSSPVLLAILEKDVPLDPKKAGEVKVPQSEALHAAFTAWSFGKNGQYTPVLREAQAQVEGLIRQMPANKSLPIVLNRVKWAIANQQ